MTQTCVNHDLKLLPLFAASSSISPSTYADLEILELGRYDLRSLDFRDPLTPTQSTHHGTPPTSYTQVSRPA